MKKLFLLMLLAMLTVGAFAVPAKKGLWKNVTLADGTEVRVQKMGDEHLHFWQDEQGSRYERRGSHFYKTEREQLSNKTRAKVAKKTVKRLPVMRKVEMGDVTDYSGDKKGLVILVQYTDVKFKTANNKAKYENILNKENYSSSEGFVGSVSDYFRAQSRGKFNLTFDVYGPVTLAHNRAYYGGNDEESDEDLAPWEMVTEACQQLQGEIDFSKYDWDGDGAVDQVFILYAGTGEADSYDDDSVWPHMWELSAVDADFSIDGIKIDTYACSNEVDMSEHIEGIGCFCHEFSHCMGFPDMYDTSYDGWFGMSDFDLMCSGSYNGNAFVPAGYSAYEMMMCSWLDPIVLSADEVAVTNLKAMSEGGESYIIYNAAHPDEYYMLENRQLTQWDAKLPGAGMMITHIDFDKDIWMDNTPNTKVTTSDKREYGYTKTNDHQRITIFHADNDDDSKYWTVDWQGYGYYTKTTLSGDLYPYNSNNSLTNNSTPAATLYNANSDGKKLMNVSITDIKQNSDGTMDFNYAPGSTTPSEGDGDYEKVTDESQIATGNVYILVNEKASMAAGALGTKYFDAVDVTLQGNTVSGSGFTTFTLGGEWDAYTLLMDDGNYLTASKPKELKASASPSPIWQIGNVSTEGYMLTTASCGYIQYNPNNGNPRFMNYTSNMYPAVLYVKRTATGIRNVQTVAPHTNRIYTLDGRYVGTDLNVLGRGLYIVNGKKVVK